MATKWLPAVIKAFNTIFRNVLEKGRPNVFMAGDNAQAKADLAVFVESLGLRPLDVGGLKMAHWVEGSGLAVTVSGRATGWATGTSLSASATTA